MKSAYFSKKALKGLNRIGDILVPGENDFPSFSGYNCIEHVDDLLAFAPADDVKDLGMVLALLNYLPKFLLVKLVKTLATAPVNTGPLGTVLRQLNMGIRGIVFSLYYSEKPGTGYSGTDPEKIIGFSLNRVRD
jgi:hypothetical protein